MTVEFEWLRGSPAYPVSLTALSAPPLVVRGRGTEPTLGSVIAIVGTRRADEEGLSFTRSLAREVAHAGVTVVSGGALGIDSAAHEGALDAGGRTLVVLPSGFAPAYPPANRRLFDRVVSNRGALVCEMPDGTPPRSHTFLRRNELVAALADVVVVVEAPRGSGALSTAAAARKLGKPIFAVPSSPWDPRGCGCLDLLRSGSRICADASDVLSVCAPGRAESALPAATAQYAPRTSGLSGDERDVMLVLGVKPRHPDEISRTTGISVARVQRALLGLLLAGRVDERDGGRYVTAPPKG